MGRQHRRDAAKILFTGFKIREAIKKLAAPSERPEVLSGYL
jgi:hypothetical protein